MDAYIGREISNGVQTLGYLPVEPVHGLEERSPCHFVRLAVLMPAGEGLHGPIDEKMELRGKVSNVGSFCFSWGHPDKYEKQQKRVRGGETL